MCFHLGLVLGISLFSIGNNVFKALLYTSQGRQSRARQVVVHTLLTSNRIILNRKAINMKVNEFHGYRIQENEYQKFFEKVYLQKF